jgi:hypothetical protein
MESEPLPLTIDEMIDDIKNFKERFPDDTVLSEEYEKNFMKVLSEVG